MSRDRRTAESEPAALADDDTEIDFVPVELEVEVPRRRRGRETERYKRGADAAAPLAPVRLPTAAGKALPHPQVGARYLNYQIRRRLARGTKGLIYEAAHLHLDRLVAIKFLQPQLLTDQTAVMRFLDEARVMARIDHRGIPVIHDFGQDSAGNAYLIMQRLEGITLAERLESGEIELGVALEIAAQAAEALSAAHRAGVIHRDLKPENIFLAGGAPVLDRLEVKVVDFGLAHPGQSKGVQTASGCLVGTPAFMAPEQTYAGELSPAADLYALGCVLFELISGCPVFEGSDAEVIDAHRHRRAPSLTGQQPLPLALVRLVARMLEKEPRRRPGSGDHVAKQLRDVAAKLGVQWVDTLAITDALERRDVDRAISRAHRRLAEGTEAPVGELEPPAPFAFGSTLEPESTPPPFYPMIEGTPQPFHPVRPRREGPETTFTTTITASLPRLWLPASLAAALCLGVLLAWALL